MIVRKFISFVFTVVYLSTMAFNSYVVLTCDCASRHHHPHHGHTCCAEVCGVDESAMSFTQHCDCTHSHDNRTTIAVLSDNDRVFKSLRAIVADLPRIFATDTECVESVSAEFLFCERKIPIREFHGIPAAAPRAPSVIA